MRKLPNLAAAVALTLGASQPGFALIFDGDVTPDVIFGSGNDNGAWTIDRGSLVELGLRAKLRYNAAGLPENTFNNTTFDNTYSFNAGVAPTKTSPTAEWSFEWAINVNHPGTGSFFLDDFTYELGIDTDPSGATTYGLLLGLSNPFDPINGSYADHAIGDNTTGNGGGTVAADATEYTTLIGSNNVAQQSWQPHWFIDGFDPTVGGVYDFYLAAFLEPGDGSKTQVARTDISVLVEADSSTPVPEPGSLALLGLGLAGLGFSRRRVMG